MFLLAGMVMVGLITGVTEANYFPTVRIAAFTPLKLLFLIAYTGLGLMPVIVDGWEDLRWKRIQSAVEFYLSAAGKKALDNISLTIRVGEFIVLCGRSG
jgi:hypothetical protein